MKTLILSCDTGGGHNSCAASIKEVYEKHASPCDIVDVLSMVSPRFSKFMSGGHICLYRHFPRVSNFIYRLFEKHDRLFREGSFAYKTFARASEPLKDYIMAGGYDCVIATHVFASLILTDAVKKYDLRVKTAFVATDYTLSPSGEQSDLDYYFIPNREIQSAFVAPHITPSKMYDVGIPVRQAFYTKMEKSIAKQGFDVDPHHKHILLTCGSMGCGPVDKITRKLVRDMDSETELTVVCGTNHKKYKKLSKKYAGRKNVHIRGFEKNMSALMDSADIYITKPGGLSTAEANAKDLPMILIDAVDGCERYNSQFFVTHQCAFAHRKAKDAAEDSLLIVGEDDILSMMRERFEKIIVPNAAEEIYKTLAQNEKQEERY